MIQDTEGPRRSLKERQRQEREELILQASEEVLLEKGYQDTSMDEIAARVGIAKGTLYLHFTGKEDLILALLEREMQEFLQIIEATVTLEATVRAKLETILYTMYRGQLGKRVQLISSLMESVDIRKQLAVKRDKLRSRWQDVTSAIAALLEEGKSAGEFDDTIPTFIMVSTFLSLLPPQISKYIIGEIAPEQLVTHLAHFYFKGIAAP